MCFPTLIITLILSSFQTYHESMIYEKHAPRPCPSLFSPQHQQMVAYFKAFEDCYPGQEITKRDGTPCLIEVFVPTKNHVWVINLITETVEEEPVWQFTGISGKPTIALST